MKMKYVKFEKFVQTVKREVGQSANKEYEQFKEFVANAKKYLSKEKKGKNEGFEMFVGAVKNKIQDEVESWIYEEKKLFGLLKEKEKINIFEAFGYREEFYRDILVWLLDPDGSNNLNGEFTKLFVNYITEVKFGILLPSEALKNLEVGKEVPLGKGKRIDFIITGNDFLCAVEMKLRGVADFNQLKEYQNAIENDKLPEEYKGKNRKFMVWLYPKTPEDAIYNVLKFKSMNWWELALLLTEIYSQTLDDFLKDLIRQFVWRIFTFAEEMLKFNDRDEILTKKRWFNIYTKINNKTRRENERTDFLFTKQTSIR